MPPTFICIQCALRAFVATLERGEDPMLAGEPAGLEGNPLEHMLTVHPDPVACRAERRELEQRAAVGFNALMERKQALAKNARNN